MYVNATETRCVTFVKNAVSVGAQGLSVFHNQLRENFAYYILCTAIISRIYLVRIFGIVYFLTSILNCLTIFYFHFLNCLTIVNILNTFSKCPRPRPRAGVS